PDGLPTSWLAPGGRHRWSMVPGRSEVRLRVCGAARSQTEPWLEIELVRQDKVASSRLRQATPPVQFVDEKTFTSCRHGEISVEDGPTQDLAAALLASTLRCSPAGRRRRRAVRTPARPVPAALAPAPSRS